MKTPERCPVCGKFPKIKTYGLNYAAVFCKPWYRRKAHCEVFVGYELPSELIDKAVEAWDKKANCANLPVW